jgi:hypothetical protein
LWQRWLTRGLLSARLPPKTQPVEVEDVLPWLDTALLTLTGKASFHWAVELLGAAQLNHLYLDLRRPFRALLLLAFLADVPDRACLRSLSLHWPLGLLHRPNEAELAVPAITDTFLVALLGELSLTRHLTHLGSSPNWSNEQTQLIRSHGIEPVRAEPHFWPHRLSPTRFRSRRGLPAGP